MVGILIHRSRALIPLWWTYLTVTTGAKSAFFRLCKRLHNRKAWLFFGSDQGGKNDAIVSSIISTCRRHGVEPWSYLTDGIQKLAENPSADLEELLPYNWKAKSGAANTAEITVSKDTPKVISA